MRYFNYLTCVMVFCCVATSANAQFYPPDKEAVKKERPPVIPKLEDVNGAMAECRDTTSDLNGLNTCFEEKKAELDKQAQAQAEAEADEAAINAQLQSQQESEKSAEKEASQMHQDAAKTPSAEMFK